MKADLRAILERQANWQRSRLARSWSEKLRASVSLRRALMQLRKRRTSAAFAPDGEAGRSERTPQAD